MKRGPLAPFFDGKGNGDKKKPAGGGWKDCNTHQEAVLFK